ncbi:type II and III secretion system protein family protein [Acidocella aminolytica]|jgi:pilus assembly protein CpaC|uniref:Secretion system type II/III protein n=1 Tax=Acidocella aminolytica 101 = DSM 11237 TaxID=1120923 RepID=A0A0D6PCQ2_9PROT|nr:pilus assembly protein N-terminal domain-containing protein [Acidocella aminolytica]GAN78624.1 secretion system type II/III protein [Acidocella aminolytica 101 = DSM 11237]GBQ36798.1 Flp pilus assembly protein CpaC [Acidocella aminolytica 101 = DSM 11237]SHE43611.1 pilus assembly protein CpaC [Acidocella aminolytica 101 = DSM 11237]
MRGLFTASVLTLFTGISSAFAQTANMDGSASHSAPTTQADASAQVIPPAHYGTLQISEGRGKLVKLPRPVANLFVADESVASVRPASPSTMFVFGKKAGETDVVATDAAGNRIAQYTITVNPSQYSDDRVDSQSHATAPGGAVSAESEPGGMIIRGTVNSAEDAQRVVNQAKLISPNGKVTNDLTVQQPIQVELKVRIAQMSRQVTRELGINWSSVGTSGISIGKFLVTGTTASAASSLSSATPGSIGVTFPGGTFEGVIDALATDNLAHILAEPTLTTLSGTQASFQVGGQFPVPVSSGTSSGSSTTVSFKNYGVLLSFIPTVFSDGRIALKVSPQISTIDSSNSALISSGASSESFSVPSLTVTAATSTVVLGSGQGMAIAGLLEDTTNQVSNGVPGLSEIPILGALFRGNAFQREQQELVITVTPYIVNPVNNPNSIASPDDGWSPPNDLQRILLLRNNGTNVAKGSIPGDAGFIVQ